MDKKEVSHIVKKLDRMRRKELHDSIDYRGEDREVVRKKADHDFDIVGDAIQNLKEVLEE